MQKPNPTAPRVRKQPARGISRKQRVQGIWKNPPAILRKLERWLLKENATYRVIVERLRRLGVETSINSLCDARARLVREKLQEPAVIRLRVTSRGKAEILIRATGPVRIEAPAKAAGKVS